MGSENFLPPRPLLGDTGFSTRLLSPGLELDSSSRVLTTLSVGVLSDGKSTWWRFVHLSDNDSDDNTSPTGSTDYGPKRQSTPFTERSGSGPTSRRGPPRDDHGGHRGRCLVLTLPTYLRGGRTSRRGPTRRYVQGQNEPRGDVKPRGTQDNDAGGTPFLG